METFHPVKALVPNPDFTDQRRRWLSGLEYRKIDPPLRPLIRRLNDRPDCFTLQCCYGHFVYGKQPDPHNLTPLPVKAIPAEVDITYRIAYLALCIDNNAAGRALLERLGRLPKLDPANIQFGSPTWFWRQQVNTYALQVEPERFKHLDQAVLGDAEARRIERLRADFFARLAEELGEML
jgi:hypothetical protein